jgi:sulfite reductase alpha subunit-like flavoprotein
VLFASQTGNSEQAAHELCSKIPDKLSPTSLARYSAEMGISTTSAPTIHVTASCMQLDDFLEIEQCKWSKVVVIIASSYGVGQAPLGGYRFRDLCDAWLEEQQAQGGGGGEVGGSSSPSKNPSSSGAGGVLNGVHFALCGLGDSKYTTFFRNPTTIDAALRSVGAVRIGDLGKADASGIGYQTQSLVIERWMDGIWPHLARVIVSEPGVSPSRLKRMQEQTIELCCRINPEFPLRPTGGRDKPAADVPVAILAAVLVALCAVAVGYFL